MAEETISAQSHRISTMVMDFMGSKYRGVEFSVAPNDAHDRVTVRIGRSVPVEFGPVDWALGDRELRVLVERRVGEVFRATLP